jgi:hypothetical protein
MFWQTGGLTDGSDLDNFDAGRAVLGSGYYLKEFNSDLSSLVVGGHLFEYNESVETIKADLSSLKEGEDMFFRCISLKKFENDMNSLTNGVTMFMDCESLKTVDADMKSLVNGEMMFWKCESIEKFKGDLSSLENGKYMFQDSKKLTSFMSKLSSLKDGNEMFSSCKLDAISVCNILDSLPVNDVGAEIDLGIGCNKTQEDCDLFAKECACTNFNELVAEFSAKNWRASLYCTGRPTTTYNMRRGETLQLYTKLIEVTDAKHYEYTSEDGSKFYNIKKFHFTSGSTDGYDTF